MQKTNKQGHSLQQVSDAWEAGAKYTYLADSVFETVPNKEQYLSTLTPMPDVKEEMELALGALSQIRDECKKSNDGLTSLQIIQNICDGIFNH